MAGPEFIGASACQHDRLLVSYAKEEGRGGLLGPRALQQQAQPAGKLGQAARAAQGPCGEGTVNSDPRAAEL